MRLVILALNYGVSTLFLVLIKSEFFVLNPTRIFSYVHLNHKLRESTSELSQILTTLFLYLLKYAKVFVTIFLFLTHFIKCLIQ